MISDYNRLLRYSVPLVLLLLAFVIKALSMGYSDFASYYFGSQELLQGLYRNAYNTASLNAIVYAKGFHELFISYTPFPPFTSLFLAPFLWLPIATAKLVFNIISCFVFVWALVRTFRYFSIAPVYILLVPLVFFTPIRSNVFFGQTYLMLFALLMEGYMAYDKKQILLSSVLWALAIVLKIFPVLIFLFLLIRKQYKAFVCLLAACFVLFASSIVLTGWSAWQLYLFEIVPRINNGELNDSFTWIFQSGFMLLKNIFIYDELLNPVPLFANAYVFVVTMICYKALLISACIMVTVKRSSKDLLSFALWITASLLISPNGSTYSLILLLLPFIALMEWNTSLVQKGIIVLLLVLVCNFPNHYMASMPLFLKFPRLYFFLAFFVFVMVVAKMKWNNKIVLGCGLLFLIVDSPKLFSSAKDGSAYVLKKEEHLLIYDYTFQNQQLVYSYWSDKGGLMCRLPDSVAAEVSSDVMLKNNQIFYRGKQLTYSSDWKKKPMLHGAYIVYLSDKNRGVGFYTLRQIKRDQSI
ncbi:MAG: hypothetical protein JWO58_2332 [Chitinophagaceae bacterium]|nr:hypothetical protein [Chitinophagaceae bacterium]